MQQTNEWQFEDVPATVRTKNFSHPITLHGLSSLLNAATAAFDLHIPSEEVVVVLSEYSGVCPHKWECAFPGDN